ncbi:MAG: 50S ribosomal protein L24 [Nitrosopumilus sp. H8]|nr:MAG: 50S ribosomal protein L24 [Nitrosopumilus sp. H13]RNJ78729.1 MAG: 50S ribosomal protein L24 [Nitrosopumilus sp. H8]
MRNKMIYRATNTARSRQVGAALSKDLQKKYKKRSVRLTIGDSVKIIRGEFTGVDGKVSKVSVDDGTVVIEGLKKEKTKGDKFDVYIHASNVVVTSLNTENWWRIARLEGKNPKDKDLQKASRAEDTAPDDEEFDEQDEEEQDDAQGDKEKKESAKKDRADEREKIAEEKKMAEQKRTEQKKQKDKKRQEKPVKEAEGDDYDDDYDEEEDD